MTNTIRTQFFANALLLKELCEPKAIEHLEKIYADHSNRQKKSGLLLGYKMVVEALLYGQTDLIITCPDILGLEVNDDLFQWWQNPEARSVYGLKISTSINNPNSAYVANHMNTLLLQVVRCGPRWDAFKETAASVYTFAHTVLSFTENCRVKGTDDINKALMLCVTDYIHDFIYVCDDPILWESYYYTRPNLISWEDGDILEKFGVKDDEIRTSRDTVGRIPIYRNAASKYEVLGINAAVSIALYRMGIQDRVLYNTNSQLLPKEEVFGHLLNQFQGDKYPILKYELILQQKIAVQKLKAIMRYETSPVEPEERLAGLFRQPAFLVRGLSSSTEFHFRVLIEGLLKVTRADNRIDVLKITEHSGTFEEPHPPVSLAVLVRNEWQIFYNIDAVKRMKSQVWKLLKTYKRRINLIEIDGIAPEYLLSLCDRKFQEVSRKLKVQTDANVELRSKIPELFATLLLAYWGYHPVKTSFEPKGIGEIDAIGFKFTEEGGVIRVVEVKNQSTNQNQLMSQMKEFSNKVASIGEKSGEVGELLECPASIQEISALFITMADVGNISSEVSDDSESVESPFDTSQVRAEFSDFIDKSGIEFWDYDRFNCELVKVGLLKEGSKLLEANTMVWHLPDNYDADRDHLAQTSEDSVI